MKQRIIEHLVNATIRHRTRVIAVWTFACLLSIPGIVFLLDFDLTFKGMIGSGVDVVDDYDKIIRDFKVSGVLTVALEPDDDVIDSVEKNHRRIDETVFDELDLSGHERVLDYLREYADEGLQTLADRDILAVAVVLLRRSDRSAAEDSLARCPSLSANQQAMILDTLRAPKRDPRQERAVSRVLTNLPRPEVDTILSLADSITGEVKREIVLATMSHLAVFDKRLLLDEVEGISEARREELGGLIDGMENELEGLFGAFEERARAFAGDLRGRLVGDDLLDGEPLNRIVRGVLFSNEFSVSRDRLMFLVMVSPEKSIDELLNAKQFTRVVDQALAEMKGEYSDLRVRRTGFAAVQLDAQNAMFTDFGIMMLFTTIGILLVFFIGLRSMDYPLLSMLPLAVGILVMFGFYSLYGNLNLFSMMTPIILFGLGIDYAIHFGSRYGEVRLDKGPDAEQAEVLRETFSSIGSGLVIASLTTVFAFLSMTVSNINGFAESGILAASGVVSSFVAMMYLLPILVTWRERRFGGGRARFLRSQRFHRLGRLAASPVAVVITIALAGLALTSVVSLPRMGVERDGMKLTPQVESVCLSKDLEAKFNFTDAQVYVVLKGYDQLKKFRRELARKVEGQPAYPAINTGRVMDARKAIRTFEKMGWDRDIATLDRYVEEYASTTTMMGGSSRNIADMFEFVVRNYVNWETDEYLAIVPPSGYVWDSDLTEMYMADLSRLEGKFDVSSAGFIKIWTWLIDHIMSDLLRSTMAAFVLMLLVLFISLRSVRGTLICALTMSISFIATLSVIGMLGIKFNYVNVMAFPLIIGLGIDYIVHIYHRLVHTEGGDIVAAVSSTGKAVLLTTLTTLMAFGTISFSIHKGLSQTGIITSIGLTIALVASLFVVPVLVRLLHRPVQDV